MTYRGRVKNGTVVLEPGVKLPEGAVVRIELEPEMSEARHKRKSIFEVSPHDGGTLLRPWTREGLMDEMLDP